MDREKGDEEMNLEWMKVRLTDAVKSLVDILV